MQEDRIVQLGIRDKVILEIGCYNGYLEIELVERGSKYAIGVDINPFNLGTAAKVENLLLPKFLVRKDLDTQKILEAKSRVDFSCSNALFLPFKERCFDIVICSQMLEHVQKPEEILNEIRRILKSDGKLFVSVPNRFCFRETHNASAFLHWLPYRFWVKHVYPHAWRSKSDKRRPTWFVYRFYTRFLLHNQLIEAGFKVIALTETQYVPSSLYALIRTRWIRTILLILNQVVEKLPFLRHLGAGIIAIALRP
jgi:SAM-dependent methyltransferase